jgi:DNA polymerase-1
VEYLGYRKMSFDEVMGKDIKDFSHVRIEDATRYSGEDAVMTLRLKEVLEEKIRDEGLERVFYEIEIPLIDVLADMEQYGIKIDVEIMKRLSEEIDKELAEIEKSIYSASGEEFNINSPKQLQDVLFTKLGLKPVKRTKTGYSTNMDVLEQLANEHPLPRMIIEYRTLSKLKSTYIDALPRMIHPHTGRIHTSFNQTVTATGRLSSSEPNLQNIPIRGEWGTKIREAFIADKGFILLSSDYSQIELRILAHLSNDSNLIKIFTSDGDIHASTASEIFGVPPEDVTPDMRRSAKSVNFGIVYGISPFGLGQQLNISPEEAKGYIERYFKKHKGVKNYIEAQIMRAKKNGYVETITGRKRAIPELRSKNKSTKQLGERLAVNTPIQGSAADIIKIAMINISKRIREEGLRTRLILQVHDELLFEVPEDEIEIAEEIIRYEMENAVTLRVPLKVDIGKGKNWAETH